MRVYLGDSGKLQVYVNKQKYALNLYTIISIINGIRLMSSEPYYLRDENGNQLTVKEE